MNRILPILLVAFLLAGCREAVVMAEPEPYTPPAMPVVDSASIFAAANRKVSYKVQQHIKTNDEKKFDKEVLRIVGDAGGIVNQYQRSQLEVMIPVENAERIIAEIARLGNVARQEFLAHNFTELMNSFDIRLNDLSRQRIRLTRLWNQADSIEDMMRIERELAANSTDYARMMSSMRETCDKINNVTLTIKIESD